MNKLDFILNGGETRRYHTWPVLRQQTVAEHSHHVAMLVSVLVPTSWTAAERYWLIMAALTHDLAEWKLGDLPAPAKRSLPNYPDATFRETWGALEMDLLREQSLNYEEALDEEGKRILKLADAADGCLYCIRERAMGNKLIRPVWDNFWEYFTDLLSMEAVQSKNSEWQLREYLYHQWNNANV